MTAEKISIGQTCDGNQVAVKLENFRGGYDVHVSLGPFNQDVIKYQPDEVFTVRGELDTSNCRHTSRSSLGLLNEPDLHSVGHDEPNLNTFFILVTALIVMFMLVTVFLVTFFLYRKCKRASVYDM